MAHVQRVQKKTSTMSLTISSSSSSSSAAAHRNSSLVQPLCVSPQRTQSPDHTQQHSGGVAPTFVKCLHDVSTLNGQLVVLECRLRGTPPLQVMWYREDEQVLDSDDFRILRKSLLGISARPPMLKRTYLWDNPIEPVYEFLMHIPEELCTLVITEAFPEDSGLFQCVALNPFGRVSCSAVLEVYNDLEEQLEAEAAGQQEEVPPLRRKEAAFQHETASFGESADDFPPELPDSMTLPPPEWPDSPVEDNKPVADFPQPANHSFEEPFGRSEEVRALSSGGQRSPGITVGAYTPSPPPPTQVKEQSHTPMFSPTKLSFPSGGPTMNLSDLPSFTPSVFPPSAFNYERPRHFIQSQAAFQAPSYDSVLKEAQENQNSSQQNLGSFQNSPSATETQSGVNMTSAQRQSFSQTQSVSESLSQSQAQLQSLSLSQSQAQSKTQVQSQSHTQVQSQSHSQAQAQSKTQVQSQSHTQVQSQSHSQAQSQAQSKTQVQSQSHTQVQSQSHSQAQSKTQVQSQSHTQGQSQAQSKTQVQSQSHTQAQAQSHTQVQSQAHTQVQSQAQSKTQVQIQTRANGMSSSSISSPISPLASSGAPPQSSPAPILSPPASTIPSSLSLLPRTTMRSTITLTPSIPSATGMGSATLPANQDTMSAPAAYLCSVLPSQSAFSPFSSSKLSPNSNLPHFSTSPSRSPSAPRSPLLPTRGPSSSISLPEQPLPVSPSLPGSPLSPPSSSSSLQQPNGPSGVPPAVVSLPASYKAAPSILPKPILKKAVAPRPSSSRSTDEDIQGSKDALIQDLEKKLRSKEARRRTSQKLSYEERMARRLLGPDNANYTFDQDSLSDSQPDQILQKEDIQGDSVSQATEGEVKLSQHCPPPCRGRRHTGTDERGNEGSAIQEKCYAPRFLQVPPDLTVEEGRFCRIDFKVGGLPTPDVCWYLDGKAIRPDDFHKMLVCEKGMHSFLIEIVTVHHAGVYECVARNRAGEGRFSMRLNVLAQEALRPPTFVQKMSNSRALEGDTVRLECKVDASPPPQLFWKKDKDMLRIDPNRMSLYQDGSGRQCLLLERLLKSDAGWYTLSAINEAGMSTCNARLDVGTRTAPPMKTAPPGSKTLKMLSSLSHVPTRTVESPAQHTAPLYESEEL